MNSPDFEIFGKGNIGEKARQLLDKTPRLREIGFYVPKRTILAQDFFDGFFQRNNLGRNLEEVEVTEDLEQKIRRGSLTREEFETLQGVTSSYDGSPLAIRSSAEGDARGTGTYESKFSSNHVGKVRKQLLRVLASYFSEDAVAFRRDSESGEGFGVMVEPIVGQQMDWVFAPVYSGFGYTSTSKGAGYINIVSGLLGGVSSKDGEKITEEFVREHGDDLTEVIFGIPRRSSHGLRDGPIQKLLTYPSGYAYFGDIGRVERCGYKFKEEIDRALHNVKLGQIFDYMKRMEDTFGKPQYFEWAMTVEDGKPKWHILQIADVDKKTDIFEFGDTENVLFDCHTVTGSGIKEGSKVFNCWNPDDVDPLYEFNQHNEGYVLLFSSRLTTSIARGRIRTLHYSDFSNASVFVEIQDANHTGDPVAHLGGQLDETGKFFGVLNYDSDCPPNSDLLRSREKDEFGVDVYQGKVKTIASERQDRMQVVAID